MKRNRFVRIVCMLVGSAIIFSTFWGCAKKEYPSAETTVVDRFDSFEDFFESATNDSDKNDNDVFVPDCREGHENVNGNTHANLVNKGLAAEQDGWIYFYIQPRDGNSNDGKICKHRVGETEITEIAYFENAVSRLSVKGDYIYYLDGNSLYKMRTDGSNIQDVFVSDENIEKGYMIVGDYIYVIRNEKYSSTSSSNFIVRYPLDDTTECEKIYKLNEGDVFCGVTGEYIIVKINSDSREKETLAIYNMKTKQTRNHTYAAKSGTRFSNVQLTEDAIYYTDSSTTCMVKLKLDDMSVIDAQNINLRSQAINFVDENTVYLTVGNWETEIFGSASELAKMSFSMLDNGNYHPILEESAEDICIVDGWIYYTSGTYSMENYCRVKTNGTGWEMLYEYV